MNKNFFNIVLHNPEIPQNTGNIARLCVANDLKLHLVKPLGFEITDKHLKRSGLDYWQFLEYETYENWEDFLNKNFNSSNKDDVASAKHRLWLLTTKTKQVVWDVQFQSGDFLVFGAETKGLPVEIREEFLSQNLTLPMSSENSRSLNFASTVQTVYYEAFRQQCR